MGRYPQRQRVAAYAVVIRDEQILLSRLAPHIAGGELWALPGGGLDHGEDPGRAVVREIYEETGLHASVSREARVAALRREVHEECGVDCEVGQLLGIHDVHFTGTAPSGRHEDYHGVHLVFAATVAEDAEPRVLEVGGTTDAVAWVPVADVEA